MQLERYGPWALIVGGSEGVGASFARKLAAGGFKLVLAARKPGPLETLAEELRGQGAEVRTLSIDLAKHDAIERMRTITDDIEIGLMIYNAGANEMRGNFVELAPETYRAVIGVNVVGQSEFARHYGAAMCARGRGGMILTGSLSGFIGSPGLATYGGAKAFSRIFSEALWAECAPFGVDVLHLVIGFTATPAMERLGIDVAKAQSPDEVAQEGLDNLANGPIWIMGGQAGRDLATLRSKLENRAETLKTFATPPRSETGKVAYKSRS